MKRFWIFLKCFLRWTHVVCIIMYISIEVLRFWVSRIDILIVRVIVSSLSEFLVSFRSTIIRFIISKWHISSKHSNYLFILKSKSKVLRNNSKIIFFFSIRLRQYFQTEIIISFFHFFSLVILQFSPLLLRLNIFNCFPNLVPHVFLKFIFKSLTMLNLFL